MIEAKQKLDITTFNYPLSMPIQLRHRISFWTHHGSLLDFQPSQWLVPCDDNIYQSGIIVILIDIYNNNSQIELCSGNDTVKNTNEAHFESLFHSLTIEYERINYNESFPFESLGSITSTKGKLINGLL